MTIKTLQGIDSGQILTAFNTSFSDYFVPLQLAPAQFEAKLIADNTQLNLSVGVFEDDQLVGFILHGLAVIQNQKIAYKPMSL